MREIVAVAAVVGSCWLTASFTLLWWAVHVAHLALGPLQTFFFVYLVFSSQATILVVREREHAWSSRPAFALLLAIVVDVTAVSALALTGTLMTAIPAAYLLLLFGVVVTTALAVDLVKFEFIRRTAAFGPGSRLQGRRAGPAATPRP